VGYCSLAYVEDRLPALAALLRHVDREIGPPTVLEGMLLATLTEMWRHGFSRDSLPAPDARTLVADLRTYSQWYSEDTLRRELATWWEVR
jgi:hypothetical protein